MKLTWHRQQLHLRHPFNIARLPRSSDTNKAVLIVEIEHNGRVGFGEAAPVSAYRQSLDSAEAMLASAARMLGHDPFALDAILDRLWGQFGNQSAAIAAIDGALHDLVGKMFELPVWKWLGLDPSRAPLTSFTIGIDDVNVVAAKVREAADYPILKIKVGTPNDNEILTTVRNEAPDKILRIDANCAWNSANVLDRCRHLSRLFDLELIEQPTAAGDHDALPTLKEAGIPPIVADESCVGIEDVQGCVGYFDGINIKLSKCGGIRQALRMIQVARSAGLRIMLGCMVETSVGIAAAAQLAPLADWLDLDGHLLLANDPFEGIGGQHGRLTLSERPGLGVVIRPQSAN